MQRNAADGLFTKPSKQEHGGGNNRRIPILDNRRLGYIGGPDDLIADPVDLFLLIPPLVFIKLYTQGRGEHGRGKVFCIVSGDLVSLTVGVVLTQVAVGVFICGDGTSYRSGDQAVRLVAGAGAGGPIGGSSRDGAL